MSGNGESSSRPFTIPRVGLGAHVSARPGSSQTRPIIPNPNDNPHAVPVGTCGPQTAVVEIEHAVRDYGEGRVSRGKTLEVITRALAFTGDPGEDESKERAFVDYVKQTSNNSMNWMRQSDETQGRQTVNREGTLAQAWSPLDCRKCTTGDQLQQGSTLKEGRESGEGMMLQVKRKSMDEVKERMSMMSQEMMNQSANSSHRICPGTIENRKRTYDDLAAQNHRNSSNCMPKTSRKSSAGSPPRRRRRLESPSHNQATARKNIGNLGGGKIELGMAEQTRKVSTHGDWTIAWGKASQAIAFAFEHRRQELADYAEFMQGEFGARHPAFHDRVIGFDIAIRNEVCGGTAILLTDFERFQRHRTAILAADGIFAPSLDRYALGKSGGSTKSRSNETCMRYNTKDGCPNGKGCRYRHVCRKCGEGGHAATVCSVAK
ncbi:hypothetical protein DFP72DRAFT_943180 [Ephemerocybe angulata]|uniref:C3H1-type domain-containing protein n=1 Tax=Ephemerocybe angulata TaxID=980116 RepID=A0A8H6H957_9AGAR|nr:hypothetical protein DFP72DRAFT_943180 [Tulosesus angulatus]